MKAAGALMALPRGLRDNMTFNICDCHDHASDPVSAGTRLDVE